MARGIWALSSAVPDSDYLEAAFDAACRTLVRRQRMNGGWASMPGPTDAESTAIALLPLLDQPYRWPASVSLARQHLGAHVDVATGGFCFRADVDGLAPGELDADRPNGDLRLYDGRDHVSSRDLPIHHGPALWAALREPQPCISGAAVRALVVSGGGPLVAAACRFLRQTQGADGLWCSPLWAVRGYPTYQAVTALGMAGALDATTRSAAYGAVVALAASDHSFEQAIALLLATRLGLVHVVAECFDRLVEAQDDDGGWTPSSALRPAWISGPTRSGEPLAAAAHDVVEHDRLVTTATTLTALHLSSDQVRFPQAAR